MKIDSVAALKRIPVGTRLALVNSLMGPQAPSPRVVKAVRSKDIVVTVDDPAHKNHGRDSYLRLTGVKVEPTDNGFRIYEKETSEVCAEYTFA